MVLCTAYRYTTQSEDVFGLSSPVEPDSFQPILEGKVPGGPQLGRHRKYAVGGMIGTLDRDRVIG